MKAILLFITTFLIVVTVEAQKVYFVYFQSDNGVPFYVKLNNKVYNSTTSGYLILPNLVENSYQFTLGSPGGDLPDTRFSVDVNNSDKGFLLKKFDDGLGLFDLQTLAIHKASTNESSVSKPLVKKDDPFSKLLSKAADDSTILNTPVRTPEVVKQQVPQPEKSDVVKQEIPQSEKTESAAAIVEEKKKEPLEEKKPVLTQEKTVDTNTESKPSLPQETKQETVTTSTSDPASVIQKSEPVKTAEDVSSAKRSEPVAKENSQTYEPYRRSVVTRRAESSTTEGFGLIFLDNISGNVDTIRILIPNSTSQIRLSNSSLESTKQISNTTSSQPVTPVISTHSPITKSSKTNCTSSASEETFRKLRKNMAGEDNDQDMIEEARKAFRTKCFTTEQIRHLSALFLSAETKYRFFDAAYRHVSDIENFPSLQSEIKDEYYAKRFNALIAE